MTPSFQPQSTSSIQAWAYDRSLRNRRPVFAMTQHVSGAGDSWHTERTWAGAGPQTLAVESTQHHRGALCVSTELATLNEYGAADILDSAAGTGCQVFTRLRSDRTGGQVRERTLHTPYPVVTLASLPVFVARHWERLVRGQALAASYLVLKVQRAATVDVQWLSTAPQGAHVAVTPRNWLLRSIFGSTRLYVQGGAPVFTRQEGLLDPRDLRPNGRWKEYLGTLEFDQPWDLTAWTLQGGRA